MNTFCSKVELFNETEQKECFVRTSEIDKLAGWIYRGEWALVIGPLYSGKTIVLYAAHDKLHEELGANPPVFFEYRLAKPQERLFVDDLLGDIRSQLCLQAGVKTDSIKSLNLRESLSKLCANLQGRHVVIFIHDIDRLEGPEANELAQQLREVYNFKREDENLKWLSVVISGRRELRKLSSQPVVSPLHLSNQIHLGELSLEETLSCLQYANKNTRVRNLDRATAEILAKRILEETYGHPHLTIRLIEETLKNAQLKEVSPNTAPKVVEETIDNMICRFLKVPITESIEKVQEKYIHALLTDLIRRKDSLELIWNLLDNQTPGQLNLEVADRLHDDQIIRRENGSWLIHNRFLESFLRAYFSLLRVATFKASLWDEIEYWNLLYQEALKLPEENRAEQIISLLPFRRRLADTLQIAARRWHYVSSVEEVAKVAVQGLSIFCDYPIAVFLKLKTDANSIENIVASVGIEPSEVQNSFGNRKIIRNLVDSAIETRTLQQRSNGQYVAIPIRDEKTRGNYLIWLESSKVPPSDEVLQDIEQFASEAKLAIASTYSRRQIALILDTIFEASPERVRVLDKDGNILMVSPSLLATIHKRMGRDYSPIGKPCKDTCGMDTERTCPALDAVKNGGKKHERRIVTIKEDGKTVYLDEIVSRFPEKGPAQGFVILTRNVSARFTLLEMSEKIISCHTRHEIAEELAKTILNLGYSTRARVYLVPHDKEDVLVGEYCTEGHGEEVADKFDSGEVQLPLDKQSWSKFREDGGGYRTDKPFVLKHKKPLPDNPFIEETETGIYLYDDDEAREVLQKHDVYTWVNIPLAIGRELFGIIMVDKKGEEEEFNDFQLYHFSIIGSIGTAALLSLQHKQSLDEAMRAFSHDHRHYLNALRGHARVLYEIDDAVIKESSMQIIDAEITRLTTLFDNILSFSREKQGNLNPKLKTVDVKKLCESILSLFEPLLTRESIVWGVSAGDSMAVADEQMTRQILINLITNAMRVVKDIDTVGQIQLNVTQDEELVYIWVSNNGPPLSPELAEQIMRRSIPIPVEGMGLGLPISKILAQRQGGDLIVLPHPMFFKEGTTFQLALKIKEEEDGKDITC